MEENGKTFETPADPNTPKTLSILAELAPDGTCHAKIDTNNLNPEQRAKLTLYLIKMLATFAFDKINPLVNGTAYYSTLGK